MESRPVYIIIVNYLRWEDTKECINSVLRSAYRNYSLFIIDNNSGNDSLEHLRDHCDPGGKIWKANELPVDRTQFSTINLIQNEKNEGFAAANNRILRHIKQEDAFIWLLNPDMVVQGNTLSQLLQFTSANGPDCISGATVQHHRGNHELLFYGGGKVNFFSATVRPLKEMDRLKRLDYISGACLFTHAGTFEKNGLLPEDYFLYWEETDWCYAAKKRGVRLLCCTDAVCYDKISTVIGKDFLANYYYCRNGLAFVGKYKRWILPFALSSVQLRFLKRIFTGQGKQAKGVWKGLIDFLKGKQNAIQ